MNLRTAHGFTLLELMITVLIVAILAAIAYPSYQSYLARAYRSEAYTALNQWANLQEQYFLDQRRYADDMSSLGAPAKSVRHCRRALQRPDDCHRDGIHSYCDRPR
jgi:type IV pilus assembly protein PilE